MLLLHRKRAHYWLIGLALRHRRFAAPIWRLADLIGATIPEASRPVPPFQPVFRDLRLEVFCAIEDACNHKPKP